MRIETGRRGLQARIDDLWYRRPDRMGILAPVASICGRVYELALHRNQRHLRAHARRLPAFVLSVGNLVAGGTGKTPMVLHVGKIFAEAGKVPAVLSRGYGGDATTVARVDPREDVCRNALLYGDEPTLMAERLAPIPVWVGRERWKSGLAAIETDGTRILILDDGFQHLGLERNLDLVLLDATLPFGNGCLLPLGPLREPPEHLDRAHAIILTRCEDPVRTEATVAELHARFPEKRLFTCRHRLTGLVKAGESRPLSYEEARGLKVVAFTGIAHPDGFFASLRTLGVELLGEFGFPDHHRFRREELEVLLDSSRRLGASWLVTTEKDHVRLPTEIGEFVLRAPVELDFGPRDGTFRDYLLDAVARHFRTVG